MTVTAPVAPGPRGNNRQLAGWLAVVVLTAVTLSPLTAAWSQAQDLGHGWGIPLLAAYLWWERWDERPTSLPRESLRLRGWIAAAVLFCAAVPLRLLLTPFPLWPAILAAYTGVMVAVMLGGAWLAAGAAGLRWAAAPLIMLPAALPWPSLLEAKLIGPLREFLATLSAEACNLLGVPALAFGTTVRLAETWIGVDETCGGMRSLQAGVMAALFLGEWLRLTWPRRTGLVAVGAAAAVLGNLLRIFLLTWRATVGGEAALNAAHDVAGWLAIATSLGLTGLAARWLRTPRPVAAGATLATPTGLPRAALQWAAILAIALGALELGTRAWYRRGTAQQAAAPGQWTVRFPGPEAAFRAVPLTQGTRDTLGPDHFAAGEWRDAKGEVSAAYYVEWHRGQTARFVPFLHNPTVCLPMSGCELVRAAGTTTVHWASGELPFHTYVFRRAGDEFAVGFVIWDPSRRRSLQQHDAGWRAWVRERLSHIAEARIDQPAQLFTVAVWGPQAEARLPAIIAGLIAPR